jgi:lipopolysaccharide transport protein LptA
MNNKKIFLHYLRFIFVAAVCATVWASAWAQENRFQISANSVTYNQESSTGVFSGNVVITRGDVKLNAAWAEYSISENGTGRAVARGSPLTVSIGMPEDGESYLTGTAKNATIDYELDQIELKGDVQIKQNNTLLTAHSAVYDIESGEIRTFADQDAGTTDSRTTIIIESVN